MIINAVKAQNVLKYASLDLEALPEQGIIAISGANESGKSTIGETICFALFGRTFSLGEEDLDKVLRWGEDHCSVSVDFSIDGAGYRVARFLDRDGNHSARLSRVDDEENPLARGVKAVSDRLFEILGYEFDEFVESFYLAQREITTPHPHSVAVKTMAGVAPLEHVAASCEEEISQFDEMIEELEAEAETLREEQNELNFEEGLLVRLEERKNALEAEVLANKGRVVALENAQEVYAHNQPLIKKAKGQCGRAIGLRFVAFVLALLFGGAWALLTQGGQLAESEQLLKLLQQQVPNWQDAWIPYIGYIAIALAVFMVLFWMRVVASGKRVRELGGQSTAMAVAMEKARAVRAYQLEKMDGEDEAAVETEPDTLGISAVDAVVRPSEADYAALLARVEETQATTNEVRNYVDEETRWLREQISRKEEVVWRMNQEVEEELERVRQMARLTEVIGSLEQKSDDIRADKERRIKAIELLEGASRHLSNNFNKEIRDLVARTLPIFTQGRYEHLHIDPDLNVRVFSSDKRDFMDLEEVSSGTQRQIMLALRLALSQKLLHRRVKGQQFAFLDEPFAFFDEQRTLYALKALGNLSENLSQIWIVAQTYPEGAHVEFATRLECSRERDSLSNH